MKNLKHKVWARWALGIVALFLISALGFSFVHKTENAAPIQQIATVKLNKLAVKVNKKRNVKPKKLAPVKKVKKTKKVDPVTPTGLVINYVNVTAIKGNGRGQFVFKGVTSAPKGSRVFLIKKDDTSINLLRGKRGFWASVDKSGKFVGFADAKTVLRGGDDDSTPRKGDTADVYIFAVPQNVANNPKKFDTSANVAVIQAFNKADVNPTKVSTDNLVNKYFNKMRKRFH
ncbi:MAG: hypothetical protein Q3960_01610 [Lactobacillus sp.]|nr:hypothetical protein [Lactobacillus sp.]